MEYEELIEEVMNIIKALKNGNYEVDYNEPNNIYSCTAPDGRTFYKQVDMDSARSCNDFGSINIEVLGWSFFCELGNGDVEASFFDEIENADYPDDAEYSDEDLKDMITDAFYDRKDILWGDCSDLDDQVKLYALANHLDYKNIEYYFGDDGPVDIDDDWVEYRTPEELGYGAVCYNHRKYYLVEEPTGKNGEKLHACYAEAKPDDSADFETVILTIEYVNGEPNAVALEECNDYYNGTEENFF